MKGGDVMRQEFRVTKQIVLGSLTLLILAVFTGLQGSKQASAAQAPAGKAIFSTKCAICHGQDGSGNTPTGKNLKIKDLRSAEVQHMSDADLTNLIAKGKGKMPAYEKSLGADKITQVVAYIRELGRTK
jgi:mono/diheme cytochrome c family protein